jgi:nucleotide-binding universal stress UspA family protein
MFDSTGDAMTIPAIYRQFRQILCPVDFSEYSRTALRHAAVLARRNKCRLTILFVNDPLLGAAAAAAAYDVQALTTRTTAELRRFAADVIGPDTQTVSIVTAFGHPAPEIKKAAQRIGADLVVMGSRGLTGPAKWFLGSTTERVLRSTGVPVLVVPPTKNRSRSEWGRALRSWPGKRVLVPVDVADHALADVRTVMNALRAFDAAPLLVSVVPAARFPSWLKMDKRTYDRDRVEAARKRLEKIARSVGNDAECRVVTGDPAEQIAACAADTRAGLIVLTLKRASSRLGPRQGSITYRVLSREVTPILAIPARPRS